MGLHGPHARRNKAKPKPRQRRRAAKLAETASRTGGILAVCKPSFDTLLRMLN